jgi:hypothetical protein
MKTARLATHVSEFAVPKLLVRAVREPSASSVRGMDDLRVEAADRRGTEVHHES